MALNEVLPKRSMEALSLTCEVRVGDAFELLILLLDLRLQFLL